MTNPVVLPYQNSDVSQALNYINDLTFDEDSELFLQIGLLCFLAGFIWFMNSKWRWQEVFAALNSLLEVLGEGLLPSYS